MTNTKPTTVAAVIASATAAGVKPAPFGRAVAGHPSYSANLEKVGRIGLGRKGYGAGQTECCAFCGKLAIGADFYGYLDALGNFVEAKPEPTNDDLGLYPLGSDCARQLRKLVPVYTAKGVRA